MSKGGPLLIASKHHITKQLRAVVPIWGYHWGHGRKSQHLHTPQNANGASRQAKHNQIDYKYVQVTKSRMLPRCLFWGIQWTQCRLKFWNIHVSIHVSLRSKQERRRSWKQQRNVIFAKVLATFWHWLHEVICELWYSTHHFFLFKIAWCCAHDTLSSCRITKAFALFRTPFVLDYSSHDLSMFSLSLVPSSKSHKKWHGGLLVSATCR